ncbi:MAG: hypothetical protein JWL75_516 [Parcubacteria group bacterium]|nr:hypothetical protein [Parcubacteria group bacterium]
MSLYADRADEFLQAHKLSRTPGRIALLKFLAAQRRPVSVEYLRRNLKNELDQVSLYRALEAFVERGMVVQFDFGHGHAHYELAHDRPHHHHAVCESCGTIEDIPAQDRRDLLKSTLQKSPGFAQLTRHSLEFYGLCVSCAP